MSHELRLEIVVIPIIVITIIVRWSQILNLKISDVDRLTWKINNDDISIVDVVPRPTSVNPMILINDSVMDPTFFIK